MLTRTKGTYLALAAAVLFVSGCGGSGSSPTTAAGPATATAASPSSPSAAAAGSSAPAPTTSTGSATAAAVTIRIKDFAYQGPASVPAGAMVTVMNMDSEAHTVTADEGSTFDVNIKPGQSATFKAPDKAGTYAYHCTFHSNMHGMLVIK